MNDHCQFCQDILEAVQDFLREMESAMKSQREAVVLPERKTS